MTSLPKCGKQPYSNLALADGTKIAVIGGGPAGSFFGIHALEAAQQAGRHLTVTIFEPKSFSAQGPVGCNKSAGILSPPLLDSLAESGLSLPPVVQMGRIGCFMVHLRGQVAAVPSPGANLLPATVYRGGGPQRAVMEVNVSFDGWLLREATARGVTVVQQRVVKVSFAGARPQVQTPTGAHTFDLVVLATGVNGHPPSLLGVAYQPPRTETMAQGELFWHDPALGDRPAATARVYLDGLPGLIFAALVPKGRFASISILGRHLPPGTVRRFLARSEVEAALKGARPPFDKTSVSSVEPLRPPRLCGCRPQIAIRPAQRFYADRFVAIGDAAVTRLYKDGIGSAFQTAQAAAHTAVFRGVDAQDFATGYAPTCQAIQRDNRFGWLLFSLWGWLQRSPRLGRALLWALDMEAELPAAQWRWRPVVWSVLTGGASYEAICRQLMRPQVMTRLIQALQRTSGRSSS